MIKKNMKIANNDAFIPFNLIENIIKETDIEKVTIEEEQSELYYETLSGNGRIFFKNNCNYEGNVRYGILDSGEESTGKKSIIIFSDGTKYEGTIRNNQITGKGEYTFNTNST
jgi:hypothetical protein